MKKLALLFAAAALCATSAMAQENAPRAPRVIQAPAPDRLTVIRAPEIDFFAEHDAMLHQWFKEVYADDVRIRMVALPSFSSNYAIGLKGSDRGYRVVYLIRHLLPPATASGQPGVKVERCEAEIDASRASRIIETWRRMLVDVIPHEDRRTGLDGTLYEFSMRGGNREFKGQTWSPDEGTRPARLAEIADTMTRYCVTRQFWLSRPVSWYFGASLDGQISELLAKIPADGKMK